MIVMAGLLSRSGLGAAGFALLLSSVAAFAADGTVVLRGARILTMDPATPEASAIALVDGKIAALGSPDDVAPFLDGPPSTTCQPMRWCCPASRTDIII